MPRGILTKNNLTKEILLKIAEVGILTIPVLSSPYFLHKIAKKYFKNKIDERARRIRLLEKRRLLDIEELKDGSVKVILTRMGKKIIHQYKIEELRIEKPLKWDGRWRIVIYDIPQNLRRASNAFSRKIRSMGLYQLQKSIWVYPYDCLSELEFLCAVFDLPLEDCILYFKTEELPKEKQIRKFFKV
jgi:hypothetical protein